MGLPLRPGEPECAFYVKNYRWGGWVGVGGGWIPARSSGGRRGGVAKGFM